MKHWKQALIAGSAGASAALFLQHRKTGGMLLAGVSLVTLASEHTEKFQKLYQDLPDFIDRGSKILEAASIIGAGVAKFAESRGYTQCDGQEVRNYN